MDSPIKWHGGKHYLAGKILALAPRRCLNPNNPGADDPGWLHYVEPFFGSGAVLFANDPEGISEVVNDLHGELTTFFSVLQDDQLFARFKRQILFVPFSEVEFQACGKANLQSDVMRAYAFFVRCRQSQAGRMKSFAPISRNRTRRGMNEQVAAWLSAVEGLSEAHERLKRVLVLNRPAVDVIRSQDGARTLFYCDPPYLDETRTSPDVYAHEMSRADHAELLKTLGAIRGRFLLSGYQCGLYDQWADKLGWARYDFDLPNNAAGGAEKRRMTESVWTNFQVIAWEKAHANG